MKLLPLALAATFVASIAFAAPQPATVRPGDTPTLRLRKAIDVPIARCEQVIWSPDGKRMAIRAAETTESETKEPGVLIPAKFKRNLVVVIPDVTAAEPRFLNFTLPRAGRLVGFTPDGKQLITDLREYNLVSGFHRLSFWEERTPAAAAGTSPASTSPASPTMIAVRTIDLDDDQTHGYAIAADGKTFRTISREESRPAARPAANTLGYTRIEVREVSLESGASLRTPLKVEGVYKAVTLSPNGSRLAALDAASNRLTVWDVARGEKLWSYDLPGAKEEPNDEDGPARAIPVRARSSSVQRFVNILFSPDARQLVCFRDPEASVVLNADKGEPLPSLEHSLRVLGDGGFAASGRLLAASGSSISEEIVQMPEAFNGIGAARARGNLAPNGPGAGFGTRPVRRVRSYSNFVGVWDAVSGKQIRSWDRAAHVAVHPTQAIIAILENNGEGGVRLGLWTSSIGRTGK